MDDGGWDTILFLAALFAIFAVPVLVGTGKWFERTAKRDWAWAVHVLVGIVIGWVLAVNSSLPPRSGTETVAKEVTPKDVAPVPAERPDLRTGSIRQAGSKK